MENTLFIQKGAPLRHIFLYYLKAWEKWKDVKLQYILNFTC